MNQRKAKQLRRIAEQMATSMAQPVLRFFVDKTEEGIKDSLVPMALAWPAGTPRRIYQDLK